MNEFRFFLGEAWEYLVRGRGTTLASVVALSAVFFLFALVLLVSHNVRAVAGDLESRKGMTVFFTEAVSLDRAREMGKVFLEFGEVAEVELVDRDTALDELEADLGGFPIGNTLGENPLPHTLVVALTPEAASEDHSLRDLAHEILAYEDVEDVVYGDEWVDALDRNLRLVRLANVSVGGLAAVAVAVVLLTTLKLLFVSRRDTLRILKVVGATDQFIRLPFLFLGAIQCLLGGGIALVLLHGARLFFDAFFPGVRPLPLPWQFAFLIGTALLGALATYIAIEPALRRIEDADEDVLR